MRLIQLNLNSRLMPTWLDRHRSRLKKQHTQTFKLELSPIVLWNYSFLTALVVRSSPTMWSWPNTTPPWTASTTSSSTAPSHTAPLGTQRIFYHSTANLSPVHYHLPRLTPTTTISHCPPEHTFGQPSDLSLHWTNRQPTPTPTFSPQERANRILYLYYHIH